MITSKTTAAPATITPITSGAVAAGIGSSRTMLGKENHFSKMRALTSGVAMDMTAIHRNRQVQRVQDHATRPQEHRQQDADTK